MTFSANAWKVAQETGDTYWRIKIDGWWMVLFSECNHCQSCYQRHFQPASAGHPRDRANQAE